MENLSSNNFNYGGDQGLYVNALGQLIEPLFGQQITGISPIVPSAGSGQLMLEEWEDEDYTLLS